MAELPNWFAMGARHYFSTILLPHFGVKDGLRMLQIGAFTGDASVWLATNMLHGPDAVLIDVDTWLGSPGEQVHEQLDWDEVYFRYMSRMQLHRPRVVTAIGTSDLFFAKNRERFHFIYVDGDHTAEQVYTDACNAHDVLVPGGILAFDDYTWLGPNGVFDELTPRPAIDQFLAEHREDYDLLTHLDFDTQVWLARIEKETL